MARVVVISRNSRTADRQGRAASPFASSYTMKRVLAAKAMVGKRQKEIQMLEDLLRKTADPKRQQRYTLRLLASINNRNSWLDYLADGSPKEPRAVVTP